MHERVTFGVLQEYARSGQIEGICLVSNNLLENILDNVPIMGYYKKLNDLIVSTIHMINVYKNSDPVMGSLSDPGQTKIIYTVGIFDIENNQENLKTINSITYVNDTFIHNFYNIINKIVSN